MVWRGEQIGGVVRAAYPFAIVAAIAGAGIGWGLSHKPVGPSQEIAAFLNGFEGHSCFLVRSAGEHDGRPALFGVGADRDAFTHFYSAFIHFTGVEPDLTVRLIAPPQCPAVDLIAQADLSTAGAPRIQLSDDQAAADQSLAGGLSNLAGRAVALLLLTDDGQVRKLDISRSPGDDRAVFSIPRVLNASPNAGLEIVIAIASAEPSPALADFREGAASEILPRLRGAPLKGAIAAAFFRYGGGGAQTAESREQPKE